MDNELCEVGMRVRIDLPSNSLLNNETGVVVDRPESDEALVKFDRMKPEFDHWDDTRTGCVTVCPENLVGID